MWISWALIPMWKAWKLFVLIKLFFLLWSYIFLQGCSDCFSPIKIRVNFTLSPSTGLPMRVLDAYSPNEAIEEVNMKNCDLNMKPGWSICSIQRSLRKLNIPHQLHKHRVFETVGDETIYINQSIFSQWLLFMGF